MPLDSEVKSEVQTKIEKYEGRVAYLYLDSVGRVTIGVGHLLANRLAVSSIPLYKMMNGNPTSLASLKEKQLEFDNLAKLVKGRTAAYYEDYTTLRMKENDITAFRDKHIDSFYRELTNIYSKAHGYPADFDDLPNGVQMALFDMIFNLGGKKIVTVFKNFDSAIKAGDWAKAAEQSLRPQVSAERNAYVKKLFLDSIQIKRRLP